MSSEEEAAVAVEDICCANCGVSAIDDIKLKDCDGGCDLVKYCSDVCQNNNKEQHEEECKKRKIKLRDKDLFTQPEGSHWGECPICCLSMPIDPRQSAFMGCCSQLICHGCARANAKREMEMGLEERCVFCREPALKSKEQLDKMIMERVKKNEPAAMRHIAKKRYHEGDYKTALEYYTKAAELGDADAHGCLGDLYNKGQVVEKDKEKYIYHLEEAAMRGHINARHNLGHEEVMNERYERARRHFIIAANLGCNESLTNLRLLYTHGHASKEDYADALHAYKAAVDATKSSERDKAEAAMKNRELNIFY